METLETLEVARRFARNLTGNFELEPIRKLEPRELARLGRVDFPEENPRSGDEHRVAVVEAGGKMFLVYTGKYDTRNFLVGGWELEKISRREEGPQTSPPQSAENNAVQADRLLRLLVWVTGVFVALLVALALIRG